MSSESTNDPLLNDLLRDNESLAEDFGRMIESANDLRPRSQSPGGDLGGLTLRGRMISESDSAEATRLITRERRLTDSHRLAREFHEAGQQRRSLMLEDETTRLTLRAIARASYRPAYHFGADYLIRASMREFKVGPGFNLLWPQFLTDVLTVEGWPHWVVGRAKSTCRLSLDQRPSGSAFRSGERSLVTAGHVIAGSNDAPIFPEFGILSAASTTFRLGAVVERFPGPVRSGETALPDLAVLELAQGQLPNARAGDSGLFCSSEGFTASDLKGCYVAIIGHPSSEMGVNWPQEFDLVFGGSNSWEKRFMPGRLSSSQSDENGLLVHDCSTLGGTSGSPVIYLASSDGKPDSLTGKVIGVHLGGSPRCENRAIPMPLIASILDSHAR
jgi:hypothetical protein